MQATGAYVWCAGMLRPFLFRPFPPGPHSRAGSGEKGSFVLFSGSGRGEKEKASRLALCDIGTKGSIRDESGNLGYGECVFSGGGQLDARVGLLKKSPCR